MPTQNPGVTGILNAGQIPYTNLNHRSGPQTVLGDNDFWWAKAEKRQGLGLAGATPLAKLQIAGDGAPAARPLALRVDGTAAARGEFFFGDIAQTGYGVEEVVYEICTPPRSATRSRGYRYAGGAQTNVAAGELIDVNLLPASIQYSTGTLQALQRGILITGPTYSATSAKTLSEVATVHITAPTKGTNITYGVVSNGGGVFGLKVTGAGGIHTTISGVDGFLPGCCFDACVDTLAAINIPAGTQYNAFSMGVADVGDTIRWAGAPASEQHWSRFDRPIYGSTGVNTINVAATVMIEGAPAEGTNVTITNSFALWCKDGGVMIGTNASSVLGVRALTVTQSLAGNLIAIRNENGSGNTGIQFYDSGGTSQVAVSWNNAGATNPSLFQINLAGNGGLIFCHGATIRGAMASTANSIPGAWSWGTGTFVAGVFFNLAVPTANAGQTPVAFRLVGAAHTGVTPNAEVIDFSLVLARTVQFGQNTALALQRACVVSAPTYSSSAATKTIAVAATFAVTGAPAAGTNAAITDSYAAIFGAKIRVDSAAAISGAVPATLGLTGGGTGPATAAQNEWIAIDTQNGRRFVPAWA